jgi:hypothetical protein
MAEIEIMLGAWERVSRIVRYPVTLGNGGPSECSGLDSRQNPEAMECFRPGVRRYATGQEDDRSRRQTGQRVKDGVRKSLKDRQNALTELVHAIREYRKLADKPLTLQGSEYAHAVQELN